MSGLLWLASLSLLVVVGLPFVGHRAFAGYPFGTRLVLAGATGAVLVSFAMTAAVLLDVRWGVAWLVAAGAGLAAALRMGLRSSRGLPGSSPRPSGDGFPVAAAWFVTAIAVLATLAATASGAASSLDLVFFWGPKAQQFGLARTVDTAFLHDEFHRHMHPYYPPLVTNLYAFATMAAGRMSWTGATLTFPLLLAALAVGLPGALARRLGRARAAVLTALAVGAVALLGCEADIAGNGEMPLLLFETLAVALLLSDEAAGAGTQLLAGVLLAGAATTKVEGLPFVLAAIAFFVLSRRDAARPVFPAVVRLAAPSVVALSAWFAYGATRGLFYGYSGDGRFLDLHPDHFAVVVTSVVRALVQAGWGLPWLIPLAVLLASLPLERRSALPMGVAATLVAFFLFTYLHREEDPSLWISWSAPRILSPVAALTVLAAGGGRRNVARRETHSETPSPA